MGKEAKPKYVIEREKGHYIRAKRGRTSLSQSPERWTEQWRSIDRQEISSLGERMGIMPSLAIKPMSEGIKTNRVRGKTQNG